ncbi:thiosulfate oxidation carrier protein SoxY [Roseateles saccharophilus]|uniref:Sulfur-oxidizing protein SoxY n=1 Tax=Roseateles saccharophilus TaxID=304 RepID=A0A4R3UIE3_ROSSA|nr:thiosulfate oxidation carrier protein SoxY [Roseateles saccharophilus]MDG0834938.1 sulfur oxidation protein SoxY [Roseateles saccharophilus]TCU88352.1 sulfur-oxidizing protein SoxY [Roseateles saccharophilus]
MRRREFAVAAAVLAGLPEARASDEAMRAAIRGWAGRDPEAGPLKIDIAELVENGNAVPVRVAAGQPVVGLALFTPLNPEPEVVHVALGADAPKPEFGTRMRLARSQRIVAVARAADGRCWQAGVDVIVTLAACVEP